MGGDWKSFEVCARKSHNAVNRLLKVTNHRESLNCLREYLSHPEQNVSRNINGKAILMRLQMEMRNTLLENEVILTIKW